jgi:hypothetical protein
MECGGYDRKTQNKRHSFAKKKVNNFEKSKKATLHNRG